MSLDLTNDVVRILLVDDQHLFRQSLKFMLDRQPHFAVVGEASNGLVAVQKARDLLPDVILLDISMPGGDGLTALKAIRRELPAINVVMLTVSEEDADLFAAIKAGARGYLLKSSDADELLRAVEHVSRGGAVVSPLMAVRLLAEYSEIEVDPDNDLVPSVPTLTPRERETLELLAKGLTNREIAVSLCVTENTVKTHLRNVMDKLQIHNRAQATAYAVRSQLTSGRRTRGR